MAKVKSQTIPFDIIIIIVPYVSRLLIPLTYVSPLSTLHSPPKASLSISLAFSKEVRVGRGIGYDIAQDTEERFKVIILKGKKSYLID